MSVPASRPDWLRETIAGVTTFFTMAYIVVVNPAILSAEGTGMPFSGALTATVLVCFSMTLLMGVYAKLPFAVAPGMGLNAFFAYTLVIQGGVPWPVALGILFWSGVLFLAISVTALRESIALAIPPSLRSATAAGIGLLTFSITRGILWGFILHAALHVLAGKRHDVTRGAWALAALSIVLLVLEHAR